MTISRVLVCTFDPDGGMAQGIRGVFGEPNVVSYDRRGRSKTGMNQHDVDAGLVAAAIAHQADWVWLQLHDSGEISPEAILEIREALPRCVVTHFMGDYRRALGENLKALAKTLHLALVSNAEQPEEFIKAGALEAMHCLIAVSWKEDIVGVPDWEPPFRVPDVVFCGSHYGDTFPGTKEREEAARALTIAGIDFGIVGKGWPKEFPAIASCARAHQLQVYRRAKVVLSVNNFNDVRRYYSNRQFAAMASGRPVVSHHVPGISEDFKDGENCVWYTKPEGLVGLTEALLENPSWAASIGAAGRALVVERHTWYSRILQVLPKVEAIAESLS